MDDTATLASLYREEREGLRKKLEDSRHGPDAVEAVRRTVDRVFERHGEEVALSKSEWGLSLRLKDLILASADFIVTTSEARHLYTRRENTGARSGSNPILGRPMLIRAIVLIAAIIILHISRVSLDGYQPAPDRPLPATTLLFVLVPYLLGAIIVYDLFLALKAAPGNLLGKLRTSLTSLFKPVAPTAPEDPDLVLAETRFLVDINGVDSAMADTFSRASQIMAHAAETLNTAPERPALPGEMLGFFQSLWYARAKARPEQALETVDSDLDHMISECGLRAAIWDSAATERDFTFIPSLNGREETLKPALYDGETGALLARGQATQLR